MQQQIRRTGIILVASAFVAGLMGYLSSDDGSHYGMEHASGFRGLRLYSQDPDQIINKGPWNAEEHGKFLEGVALTGWDPDTGNGGGAAWKIAHMVPTRTVNDVKLHANEYFTANARGQVPPMDILPWPLDIAVHVAAGTYSHRPPVSYASHRAKAPVPEYGRVLLYISTHMSDQHEAYFRYCWRNILAKSPLLQNADVAVHLTPNDPKERKPAMELLKDIFQDHNLMVYLRNYQGALFEGDNAVKTKQVGAMMTMYEAVHYKYFDGYDWVVRVNPDVLIRDDTWFRQEMTNPDLSALLVNCHEGLGDYQIQTDFFVVRPSILKEEYFPKSVSESNNAEDSFTDSLYPVVLDSGSPANFEFIPGADPASKRVCRVGQGKGNNKSPVVHKHQMHEELCTIPEDHLDFVKEGVFPCSKNPYVWNPLPCDEEEEEKEEDHLQEKE